MENLANNESTANNCNLAYIADDHLKEANVSVQMKLMASYFLRGHFWTDSSSSAAFHENIVCLRSF